MFDCGQGNSQRYIDVTSMHLHLETLHNGLSRAVLGVHALTGADFTADFYRKGKKTPFNVLLAAETSDWDHEFGVMSKEGSEVDQKIIESFVCKLYGSSVQDINVLRLDKLHKLAGKPKNRNFPKLKKVNCSMLPPCRRSLQKKIMRATMISKAWGKADTANPSQDLKPEDFGWEKDGDIFRPVRFDGPSLPPSLEGTASPNYDDGQNAEEDLEDIQVPKWSDSSADESDEE